MTRLRRFPSALGAGVLLVLLGPLLALIAVAVAAESRGAILFRHRRVGEGGRPFMMYKFRTMYPWSDPGGPSPVVTGDSRVTRVGTTLRSLRLDELPQLINILRGEMAFVGPRPQVEAELLAHVPHWPALLAERASVRPGVTSPWCVSSGQPKDRPSLAMLESDCAYVRSRSLALDCSVVWATARLVLDRALRGPRGSL